MILKNRKEYPQENSSQDGGIGKYASTPSTTRAKNTTRLQNKYHPELSENQAVWKSNNQGCKEATFIQLGRRGGDVEKHGEAQRGVERWKGTEMQSGMERPRDWNWQAHIHMW